MRNAVKKIIQAIEPYDDLEAEHRNDAIAWIDSGVEIFRLKKPATPSKHLVSYFVVIDQVQEKVMLVDHANAGLLLLTGGIDKNFILTW